ncbi:anaphase-promoting complex, putative [Perkinsus marinus ATCC 50983]|uniref:Anaphase-promoting complex, putative n=1 Tax=Perkinsus marinus (strain ATCC 50983 / TXsc) TaxID=423536 RepID=C5LHU9_PERM5|nr:anaphase-promoting complex, putative [Perkinsus marinus ATCC 50983]EER03703.1 anaphase-promoting complex, putative [Perkinsus marinus ATCC 50983]|eukprot:XP_002771887.1 anaphase-promoting complex, putative [Perkinsus marinus ATCC 50983]
MTRRSPGEILTSFSELGSSPASHSASPSRRAAQAIRSRFLSSPATAAAARGLHEIGDRCRWSLSSAKPGYGVLQLKDNSEETFWQSDAMSAITYSMDEQRAQQPGEVHMFVSYKADESYTPSTISVRIGNTLFDLNEIQRLALYQPEGWIVIPLALTRTNDNPDYHLQRGVTFRDDIVAQSFVRTFYLQLAILNNHQNGRDTHIRQVRVYGPRPPEPSIAVTNGGDEENWGLSVFNTTTMLPPSTLSEPQTTKVAHSESHTRDTRGTASAKKWLRMILEETRKTAIERLLVVEQSLGNLENVAILRRSLDELKWRQWDRNGRMTRNDGCRLNRRERRSRSVGSYSKIDTVESPEIGGITEKVGKKDQLFKSAVLNRLQELRSDE